MVESESNTDSEEKRDTLSELPPLPKDKSKGKQITGDPEMISDVELITLKAKGIVIDEAKISQTDTAAVSKQAAPPDEENTENVVNSLYHLRSGYKGKGVEVSSKPETRSAARKRKGMEQKTDVFQGPDPDSEEVCKRFKKGRNNDDDTDKDGAGAGARTTRSSNRKRKTISV